MSASDYLEDFLVEQPAIQLMEHELGWDSVSAYGDPPSSRVVGLRRTGWSACSGRAAVEELTRDFFLTALSLVEANREIEKLRRGGLKVMIPDRERVGQPAECSGSNDFQEIF